MSMESPYQDIHASSVRPIHQESTTFEFTLYHSPENAGITVKKGTQEAYKEKTRCMEPIATTPMEPLPPVYDTRHSRKGKACIITIHTFLESSRLCSLEGYQVDEHKLSETLTQLGFEVLIPKQLNLADENNFTAEEIQHIVTTFAEEELQTEDRCAVLCILTHGRAGVLFGSDGKDINVTALLSKLDNTKCPQMAGKPKWVILQACQGATHDKGEVIRAAAEPERDTAPQPRPAPLHLPSISDMIVLYPAMAGYVSFVSSISGSFMINHLVDVLARYAHVYDLQTLLTTVNYLVANHDIHVDGQKHKQMSHFDSCLRKLLYFLPGYEETARRTYRPTSTVRGYRTPVQAAAQPEPRPDPGFGPGPNPAFEVTEKDPIYSVHGPLLSNAIKKSLEDHKNTLCEHVEEANMTVLLTELRAKDVLTSLQMKQARGKPIAYEKMGSVVDSLIIGRVEQYRHFRHALQLSSVGLQALAQILPEIS